MMTVQRRRSEEASYYQGREFDNFASGPQVVKLREGPDLGVWREYESMLTWNLKLGKCKRVKDPGAPGDVR